MWKSKWKLKGMKYLCTLMAINQILFAAPAVQAEPTENSALKPSPVPVISATDAAARSSESQTLPPAQSTIPIQSLDLVNPISPATTDSLIATTTTNTIATSPDGKYKLTTQSGSNIIRVVSGTTVLKQFTIPVESGKTVQDAAVISSVWVDRTGYVIRLINKNVNQCVFDFNSLTLSAPINTKIFDQLSNYYVGANFAVTKIVSSATNPNDATFYVKQNTSTTPNVVQNSILHFSGTTLYVTARNYQNTTLFTATIPNSFYAIRKGASTFYLRPAGKGILTIKTVTSYPQGFYVYKYCSNSVCPEPSLVIPLATSFYKMLEMAYAIA